MTYYANSFPMPIIIDRLPVAGNLSAFDINYHTVSGYLANIANMAANSMHFDANGAIQLPTNEFSVLYANGSSVPIGPGGNTGQVQINYEGSFSGLGGYGLTYTIQQFDGNGMLTIDGTHAYQQRINNSPYITVLAPRVESQDHGILAGPAHTVVGYDDEYNTPRSAYYSVQDKLIATQQWDSMMLMAEAVL